jgi:hypothetical protein
MAHEDGEAITKEKDDDGTFEMYPDPAVHEVVAIVVKVMNTHKEEVKVDFSLVDFSTPEGYDPKEMAFRRQFPLIPSAALTVHKAQGLQFARIYGDISGVSFSQGAAYTLLSRAITPGGILLKPNFTLEQLNYVNQMMVNHDRLMMEHATLQRRGYFEKTVVLKDDASIALYMTRFSPEVIRDFVLNGKPLPPVPPPAAATTGGGGGLREVVRVEIDEDGGEVLVADWGGAAAANAAGTAVAAANAGAVVQMVDVPAIAAAAPAAAAAVPATQAAAQRGAGGGGGAGGAAGGGAVGATQAARVAPPPTHLRAGAGFPPPGPS